MKKIFHIIVYIGFMSTLWMAAPGTGFCQGVVISPVEGKLLELINVERENKLSLNSKLLKVAQQRAAQFFANEFAVAGSNDQTQMMTVEESGYRPIEEGSTKAVVIFSNYLGSHDAARVLLDTIKNQSAATIVGEQVFSSVFSEIGIHVMETMVSYGRTRYNVYLAVLVYARPLRDETENRIMEARLLNLINQFRDRPAAVLVQGGQNIEDTGLSEGMTAKPLYPGILENRASFFEDSVESESYDPDEIVKTIFGRLLSSDSGLLQPDWTTVDIRVTNEVVTGLDGQYKIRYGAGIKLETLPTEGRMINGLFFSDNNENSLYDLGEELPHVPLIVYDAGIHSRTGVAGGILESVGNGTKGYQIVIFQPDQDLVIHTVQDPGSRFIVIKRNEN